MQGLSQARLDPGPTSRLARRLVLLTDASPQEDVCAIFRRSGARIYDNCRLLTRGGAVQWFKPSRSARSSGQSGVARDGYRRHGQEVVPVRHRRLGPVSVSGFLLLLMPGALTCPAAEPGKEIEIDKAVATIESNVPGPVSTVDRRMPGRESERSIQARNGKLWASHPPGACRHRELLGTLPGRSRLGDEIDLRDRRHASLSFWRISFQLDPKGPGDKAAGPDLGRERSLDDLGPRTGRGQYDPRRI